MISPVKRKIVRDGHWVRDGQRMSLREKDYLRIIMAKKDELTALQHAELLADEISEQDMRIMGVYGAVGRGASLSEALRKYDISESLYLSEIERVLNS